MAKKQPKQWVYSPKPVKSAVSDEVKAEVEAKAKALIEKVLKPEHVKRPPKEPKFNYLTDITCKWHRGYFYFVSVYTCPGPNAISPGFEDGFARLEYAGNGKFNLAYKRHTGQWWPIGAGLTVDDCLEQIGDGGIFHP
jgi:hypothetical protein